MKKQIEGEVVFSKAPIEGQYIIGRWIRILPRSSRYFQRNIETIGHWITECLHDIECEGKKVTVTLEIE